MGMKMETLTIPAECSLLITKEERMACREALASVSLALAEYYVEPSPKGNLPFGLLDELGKIREILK